MQPPAAPRADTKVALPLEGLLRQIADHFNITDVSEGLKASGSFHDAVHHAVKSFYSYEYDGVAYPDYTKMAYSLGELLTGKAYTTYRFKLVTANLSLPSYICVKSVLEAEFGYCFDLATSPAQLTLSGRVFDLANDRNKISIVPYLFDDEVRDHMLISCVRRLVKLKRFDILGQLRFPWISEEIFEELMSVPLPDSVVETAARSLCRRQPNSKLGKLLDMCGFGINLHELPENCELPLFLVKYCCERNIRIPESCVFTKTLDASSISFWFYLLKKKNRAAKRLLGRVLHKGDHSIQCLADIFSKKVNEITFEQPKPAFYQALVIYLRFSPLCNENVRLNFDTMIQHSLERTYHVAHALLECGQFEAFGVSGSFSPADEDLGEELIDEICQLNGDHSLDWLLCECIDAYHYAPELLRSLIQRKADDHFIQLVYNVLRERQPYSTAEYSCMLPLSVLKRLALEVDLTIREAKKMVGSLNGFQKSGRSFSKLEHILHTLTFWAAPEKVIQHFLNQLPGQSVTSLEIYVPLVRMLRYSDSFFEGLVRRTKLGDSRMKDDIEKFRPNLAKRLGLKSRQI